MQSQPSVGDIAPSPTEDPPGAGERSPASDDDRPGSVTEAVDRLRIEVGRFSTDPYLLTVTSAGRPHCGTVAVAWDGLGDELVVAPLPSSWAGSDTAGHREVSLLWPPADPGGYSLIVDGTATTSMGDDDTTLLAVAPTKAVLHRRGPAPTDASSACGSDCIPILTR
jgi:hypothetical protein